MQIPGIGRPRRAVEAGVWGNSVVTNVTDVTPGAAFVAVDAVEAIHCLIGCHHD